MVSLYEDREGNLWAGAPNGLWRWKPGPPKRYPISDQVTEIGALIERRQRRTLDGDARRNQTARERKSRDISASGLWTALQAQSVCSGIAMAVYGSERRRVSCMCTREERTRLRGPTVSQVISYSISSRIEKAIFG